MVVPWDSQHIHYFVYLPFLERVLVLRILCSDTSGTASIGAELLVRMGMKESHTRLRAKRVGVIIND